MTGLHDYSDIIDLPRPEPQRHTRMPIAARAAQFAPFAALSGYAAVIEEVSRHTEEKPNLDESAKQEINRALLYLKKHPEHTEPVRVEYFLPDPKKSGGSFETFIGYAEMVDDYKQVLALSGGSVIPFANILSLTIGCISGG